MKLRINPLVVKNLKEIRNYIAEVHPQKAVEAIEEIYGKFENVQLFPGDGQAFQNGYILGRTISMWFGMIT